MSDLETLSSTIKAEADALLYDRGLLQVLGEYGKSVITGSYALNLMTWRDLDIYLANDEMTERRFFDLGGEIAWRLKPHRMHYGNTRIEEVPGLPSGLYWGIYTASGLPDVWKIDLWWTESARIRSSQQELDQLKCAIDEDKRRKILVIKDRVCKSPEHRRTIFSVDVYRAVIEDSVDSIGGFSEWLRAKKGIVCDLS